MKKKIFSMLLLEIVLGLVATVAIIPIKGETEWTVRIGGAVSNPKTLKITQIMSMPNSTVYAELYCYGAYVTGGNWTGVNLSLLLDFVELDQNAMSLGFSAADGYNKAISIAEATQENVIVAYEFNGSPLPETLRLVLPGANGEFWVAMINHIVVSTNSAPHSFSGSGVNLPAVIPQSPTPAPAPAPTPTPLASPSPNPSPTPPITPTPTPFQEPSSSQDTQNSETTPEMIVIASTGAISLVGVGLLFYFKKRKH
jgi:DMSO/TMAO reductase YedYZ molybdopterin-dependent catalytic subunit